MLEDAQAKIPHYRKVLSRQALAAGQTDGRRHRQRRLAGWRDCVALQGWMVREWKGTVDFFRPVLDHKGPTNFTKKKRKEKIKKFSFFFSLYIL